MQFQQRTEQYEGHQLNGLADVQAILAIAGKMDKGHVKSYTFMGGESEKIVMRINISVMDCNVQVRQGEWLLYKASPDGAAALAALYTLTAEEMAARYEPVPAKVRPEFQALDAYIKSQKQGMQASSGYGGWKT